MNAQRQATWRLWFFQASWNREGMQSLGLLVSALPLVRQRRGTREELLGWMRPRLGFLNTNPYLSGFLLGAVIRAEQEAGTSVSRRLEKGLSRHLGAVGDGMFWEGLRPAFAFGGLAAGMLAGPAGVLVAWLGFAILQAVVRAWGLRVGLAEGVGIVAWLDARELPRGVQRLQRAAFLATGTALGVAALHRAGIVGELGGLACAGVALLCGSSAASRRWPPEWALPATAVLCWAISRLAPGL